ncbi:MAG: energy transducer TonB [Candidatus Omnitrophica bacterium]|nr:energy transducer TonB [Candidatus Omnitrophota bacterium]MBU4478454.1 energy transducer TonB [Candidatus Omnitrophota bacterium]MCG2702946.1 energy transducer TonB [Candidatus Omnitrophota bacterium]
MNDNRLSAYTLIVSILAHGLLLGGMGIWLKYPFKDTPVPETRALEIVPLKLFLLPEIKVIGEVKQIKAQPEKEVVDNPMHSPQEIKRRGTSGTPQPEIVSKEKADEAMLRYQDMIKQKIESYRRYPEPARRKNIQGTVAVQFTILSSGDCRDASVIQSSGVTLLDKEALETISRASPFLPIPESIPYDSITIRVSIVFSLR